jgi:hypothetical protein
MVMTMKQEPKQPMELKANDGVFNESNRQRLLEMIHLPYMENTSKYELLDGFPDPYADGVKDGYLFAIDHLLHGGNVPSYVDALRLKRNLETGDSGPITDEYQRRLHLVYEMLKSLCDQQD